MSLLCDSSVWLAALDCDDQFHESSRRLLDAARAGDIGAVDLTLYEVADVAVTSWHAVDTATTAVELVERTTGGTIIPWNPEMLGLAIALAHKHRLSVYDAAYVATSQALGWTLVSTDMRDLVEPGFAITPDQVVL